MIQKQKRSAKKKLPPDSCGKMPNKYGLDGLEVQIVCEKQETCTTQFWWGNFLEGEYFKDTEDNERIELKYIIEKQILRI
jgi:hypothetical protein